MKYIGSYSAVVYKDEGKIFARDREGEMIAVGESIVDDVRVIQNAINDVNTAGGGRVKLNSGTFVIDEPLILQAKVSLTGEDRGTILQRKAETDTVMIEFNTESSFNYQYVGHFKIDGNAANNASGYAILLGKDRRGNPNFVLFENIEIEDTDGIKFDYGCYWNRFVKVNVRNPVNWAIDMGNDYRIHAVETYSDAQSKPAVFFVGRMLKNGYKYKITLEQTAGTFRSFPYIFIEEIIG